MTMSKVSVPVIEYDPEEDDGQTNGPKKNWFKPADSSIAKLKEIETTVYSMRLKGGSSCKPPHGAQKVTKENKLTGPKQPHKRIKKARNLSAQHVDKRMVTNNGHTFGSTQSAPLFQTWGSSTCISELKAKQKSPSSAEVMTSHWTHSESWIKRQSATDSFATEESHNENSYTVPLAVKGIQKSVNAKLNQCPCAKHEGLRELTDPEGHRCSSVSDDDEKERYKTQRPQQQLCFCLPSADDEIGDDEDQNGTSRLLLGADKSEQREVEKDDCAAQSLNVVKSVASEHIEISPQFRSTSDMISKNHTNESSKQTFQSKLSDRSEEKVSHQNRGFFTKSKNHHHHSIDMLDWTSTDHSLLEVKSPDHCGAGDGMYQYQTKNSSKIIASDNTKEFDGKSKECKKQTNIYTTANFTRPSHVTNIDKTARFSRPSHVSNRHAKIKLLSEILLYDNVKLKEGKSAIINTTPGNRKRDKIRQCPFSSHSQSEVIYGEKNNCSKDNDSLCESGLTVETSKKKYHKSGHNTLTSEKKYESRNCNTLNNHASSKNSSYKELDYVPVAKVIVNYEDDVAEQELEINNLKKETQNELKVIANHLSELDIGSQSSATLDKPSRKANVYDRSQTHPKPALCSVKGNDNVSQEMSETQETPVLFKTTKTIEFNPQVPQESISKSVIQSMIHKTTPNKKLKQKQCKTTIQLLQDGSAEEGKQKELTLCEKKLEAHKTTDKLFTPVQHPAKKINVSSHSTKDNQVSKSKVKIRISSAPKERPKPFYSEMQAASFTDIFKTRSTVRKHHMRDNIIKNTRYASAKTRLVHPKINDLRTTTSASSATRSHARDITSTEGETEPPGADECQDMQRKMAALGIDVHVKALERALYPPSVESKYHHKAGVLPSDPSCGLIPHYKHWLPEEYKKLEMIKKKLADDNHLRDMQRLGNAWQKNN